MYKGVRGKCCTMCLQLVWTAIILSAVCVADRHIVKEYCETESFNASCEEDEVIFMKHARYGRMRLSRCVKLDYGHVGCASDVLNLADKRCSGRRSCQIRIPDALFAKTKPCPDDLKPYLEASYQCIKVITPPHGDCSALDHMSTAGDKGFVSNLITQETGCGTQDHPWRIVARPGQRLNISLFDFGTEVTEDSAPVVKQCKVYGIIRERTVSRTRNITVCGSLARERNVYFSMTHSVEISLVTDRSPRPPAFLFKYTAIGCPTMTAPENARVMRKDNRLEIVCNHTHERWDLKCVGSTWVGKVGNCSEAVPILRPKEGLPEDSPLTYGNSILVIIGVALSIGLMVLIVGLCFLRRQARNLCKGGDTESVGDSSDDEENKSMAANDRGYTVQYHFVTKPCHPSPAKEPRPPELTESITREQNDYELREVRGPCTPLLAKAANREPIYSPGLQHCVCAHMTPNICRVNHGRIQVNPMDGPPRQGTDGTTLGPHYFVLDPDVIADRGHSTHAPPASSGQPLRLSTFKGDDGMESAYQMRTFKPPTQQQQPSQPTSTNQQQQQDSLNNSRCTYHTVVQPRNPGASTLDRRGSGENMLEKSENDDNERRKTAADEAT